MTKKGFKKAMQCGLGRCIVELDQVENVEKYYDIVLWGCTHNFSYDAQCEGMRSWYTYEMIKRFADKSSFLKKIIYHYEKSIIKSGTGCELAYISNVLVYFAIDGSQLAVDALWRGYQKLYHILYKRKRTSDSVFFIKESFEELCIALTGLEKGQAGEVYLKFIEDMGNLYLYSHVFQNWNNAFSSFDDYCECLYGKRNINKIKKEKAKESQSIEKYITCMEKYKEEMECNRKNHKQQCPQNATEVYEYLKNGLIKEQDKSNKIIYLFCGRIFLGKDKIDELQKLAQMYKEEKNPVLRARLLQIFTNQACAFLLDPEVVIYDTKSEHETLSNQAFDALCYIHHEKVKEYAYTLLHDKKHRDNVICIIANNYQKEDKEIFINMVKSVPVVYQGDEHWHGVFFSVLDMFENKEIKNPPKELLLYMYENTQCSSCRESILMEMERRRMITKDILMECLWDSNENIRKYAGRKIMKLEQKRFMQRFDTIEKEVFVLTEEGTSASKCGKDKLYEASVTVLALVDVATGELIDDKGYLEWQLTEKECQTSEKIFNLQGKTIYRLKVQESLPFTNYFGDEGNEVRRGKYLWVKEVLERSCQEERLDMILEEYLKPVVIQPEGCGELVLDKSLGMFSGVGSWNGDSCQIHLDVDENNAETSEDAQSTWKVLMDNSREWDKKARQYAATELAECASDWARDEDENAEEITEDEFAKRMGISEICVSIGGDFDIYYNDDDMFWGHVIIVSGNIETGIDDAYMAG